MIHRGFVLCFYQESFHEGRGSFFRKYMYNCVPVVDTNILSVSSGNKGKFEVAHKLQQ